MIACDSSAIKTPEERLPVRLGILQTCLLVLIIGLVTSMPWAVADEDGKINNNIEAVAPLRSLLAQVLEAYPGQVLEVELEREERGAGDIWLYEVKLLTKKGSVLKLEYDAITLELLKVKGKLGN